MPIISDAALQSLANLGAKLALKDDCVIQRNSVSGGSIVTTTVTTVKSLAFTPSSPQFSAVGDWEGNQITWRVFLPRNTDVREEDILTIQGQKMYVQMVKKPSTYSVFDEVEASGV